MAKRGEEGRRERSEEMGERGEEDERDFDFVVFFGEGYHRCHLESRGDGQEFAVQFR